jgi:hypothetical protein
MNWKQIYTASTPEERIEIMAEMFRKIETRHQLIFTSGRLIRDRRNHAKLWHMIGDRRGRIDTIQKFYLSLFTFILLTVSVSTWLIALNAHPELSAKLFLTYNLILISILLIKPYRYVASLSPS